MESSEERKETGRDRLSLLLAMGMILGDLVVVVVVVVLSEETMFAFQPKSTISDPRSNSELKFRYCGKKWVNYDFFGEGMKEGDGYL